MEYEMCNSQDIWDAEVAEGGSFCFFLSFFLHYKTPPILKERRCESRTQ